MLRRKLQQQQQQRSLPGGEGSDKPKQQQRAVRRRSGPQTATLAVPLPVVPTPAECTALLKTLVKHLLFQRAQIPFLYDQLLQAARERQQTEGEAPAGHEAEAGAARRRRRAPREDRRLLKFLGQAEAAMASIDAALQAFGVPRRAFLLLGSSTAKPREAYEVLMPPSTVGLLPPAQEAQHAQHSQHAAPGSAQQQPCRRPRPNRQARLCQLALRQVVVGMAELPEGTAHTVPCKLFLLLEGGGTSCSEGTSPTCTSGQQQQQQALDKSALGAAPSGFTIKRHFRLSMRKGVHIKLLLGQRSEEAAAAASGGERQQQHQGVLPVPAGAAVPGAKGSSSDMECGSSSDTEEPTMHLSQLPDADPPSQAAVEAPSAASPQAATASPGPTAKQAATAPLGPMPVWFMCKSVVKGLNSRSQHDGSC